MDSAVFSESNNVTIICEEGSYAETYAKENNIKLTGTIRHTYLEGPPQHTNPDNFITQVALIIED